MRRTLKGIWLLTLMLMTSIRGLAYNGEKATFHFATAKVHVDENYMSNASQMEKLEHMADDFRRVSESQRWVVVHSYVSPDGSLQQNIRLANERAEEATRQFTQKLGCDAHVLTYRHLFDWKHLYRMVNADAQTPDRKDVLSILKLAVTGRDNRADNVNFVRELKRINGGAAYRYMVKNMFPQMRRVEIETVLLSSPVASITPHLPVSTKNDSLVKDTIIQAKPVVTDSLASGSTVTPGGEAGGFMVKTEPEPAVTPVLASKRPWYLALKTNLLFDVAAVPNISAEWAFADHWSVSGEYMHAWWKSDRVNKYWRTYGGNVELRYWFGKKAAEKRLTGHHVGVYGGALTYDFEWGGRGYQAHKWSKNVGLSYGYAAPIARRLNLDFELGIGYFGGEYEEYVPKGDYYFWEATKNRKWFGPTRLEATLVWLLGHGNENKK